MPEGKRIDQSAWPAAGPHRELLEFLDRVHEANGTRSLAEIASLMHLSSRSRVSNLLRGINGTLPANEDQLRRLVTALGGGLEDVGRGVKLFRAVRAQPAVGSGEPHPVARRSKLPGPKPPSDIVLYPDVLDAVIDGLLAGQLTALVGPSGYGKTALAQQMFAEPRIVAGFGEAVYWVSIGRDLDAPELAQRLNEVTQLVCDVKPEMPDPVLAAQYLAGRIDERSCLVIFDDIWQQEWPEILRFVGSACAVLVTTRDGSLLPGGVGQHLMTGPPVELGARVLKAGAPELGDLDCARVSAVTKARPFLLDLVGSQLRQEIHAGRPPSDAVDDLLQRVSGAVDIDRLVESVLGPGEGPTAESLLAWSIERLPPR